MEKQSVAIIGGGVVGLAIAREAACAGYEIFLFEQAEHFAPAQSSRNSGVIHAGMYYATDSLKARLCVAGRKMLYDFCREHQVPFLKTGKVIVAQNREDERWLDFYLVRGWANGVEGLRKITRDELRDREPNVSGMSALYSPETGIVDAGAFVQKLERLAGDAGATLLSGRKVCEIHWHDEKFFLKIENNDGTHDECAVDWVINSAGAYADEVAAMVSAENKNRWHIIPVRGEYCTYCFSEKPNLAIRGCVYGIPEKIRTKEGDVVSGLGVHLVPMFAENCAGEKRLSDTVLVGPTMKIISCKDDYESGRYPEEYFFERSRMFLSHLRLGDLQLGYAGIRSELRESEDFVILRDPRYARCVHLLGIRSPGLTGSLAIARYVKENFLRVAF